MESQQVAVVTEDCMKGDSAGKVYLGTTECRGGGLYSYCELFVGDPGVYVKCVFACLRRPRREASVAECRGLETHQG